MLRPNTKLRAQIATPPPFWQLLQNSLDVIKYKQINFVQQLVCRQSVRLDVRTRVQLAVTFLVNASPSKPFDVAALRFTVA